MSKEYLNFEDDEAVEQYLYSKHYGKHVSAMTGESLHNKSHIAIELARRDVIIEELEAKIAEIESEWVSCEDRMPEKEDDYLIYPIPKYSSGNEYFNKYMDRGGHEPNTFESESEYGEIHVHRFITHWRPLPSPPKAKG